MAIGAPPLQMVGDLQRFEVFCYVARSWTRQRSGAGQKELRALKLKLTFVTRANKELEATVGRLHAENAELRSELKAARGAVAEASSLPPPPWA